MVQETQQVEFAQPQFDAAAKKPKKKFSALLIALIAVVLAGAVTVGAFFEPIKGMAIKTFGSAEDYLTFVADKAVEDASAEVADAYGKYLKNLDSAATSGAVDASLQLNVGEKAITLLEDILEESGASGIDLDWFKNVSLDMDADAKDKAAKIALALKLNGKELANAECIVDMSKQEVFLAVLSMSDKYLKSSIAVDEEAEAALKAMSPAEIKKVLPSAEVVAALMEKYAAIVYENLENIEKSSETLAIGDVEQVLTTLKVELDAKAAQKIGIALLEAVETDEDLKKIINNVAKYMEENDQIDDADEIYEDFLDSVKEAKTELKEEEPEDADEKLKLTFYVNGSHDMTGFKAGFEDESVFVATVRDGEKFAFKMDAGEVKISGEGTEKKELVNGKYTVKYDGKKICDINVQDLTSKDDLLNGKISIAPSSDLLKDAGLDSIGASAVSLMNLKVEFVFENKKDSAKVDMNLVSGEDMLLGITVSGKEAEAAEIKMPSGDKVVEEDAAMDWLQSLDMEGLMNKLKDAGVPESLLQSIG